MIIFRRIAGFTFYQYLQERFSVPSLPSDVRRRLFSELLTVLLVLAITLPVMIYAIYHSTLPNADYYGIASGNFLPPLLFAAGHGFAFPESVPEDSALARFLRQEKASLQPEDIAEDIVTTPVGGPPALHRYLYTAIGVIWRFAGISWEALKLLSATFYIAIVLLVYRLFRVAAPRLIAAAGAIVFGCHGIMLNNLLIFRETSKGVFFLALFCLFIGFLRGHAGYRRVLLSAAAAGLLTGIGIGFRYDVIVCLPAVLLLVLTARWPGAGFDPVKRMAALALCLACFFTAGLPIFLEDSSRGSHDHVTGGFAPDIEARMNLKPASYYRIQMNEDRLTFAMMNHYARNIMGRASHVPFLSRDADLPGRNYMMRLLATFPADMLTRGYAATLTILQETPVRHNTFDQPVINTVYTLMRPVDRHLAWYGPVYAAILLLVLAARRPRAAWLLFLLLFYFGAYPSIQFFPRHYFHLTFFSLWVMAFVLCGAFSGVVLLYKGYRKKDDEKAGDPGRWRKDIRNMLLFCAGTLFLILAPLYAARVYQYHAVMREAQLLEAAGLTPLPAEKAPFNIAGMISLGSDMAIYRVTEKTDLDKGNAAAGEPYIHTRYLVALFDPRNLPLRMMVKYEKVPWAPGFTRIIPIEQHAPPGPIRVFFPIHEFPDALSIGIGPNRFEGIVLNSEYADSFLGLYEVSDISRFPMLLETTLAPGGRNYTWCQRLRWQPAI
jgi:hypothetical protein